MYKNRISGLLLCMGLMVYATTAFALEPVFTDFTNTAIKGYDPVAYFKKGKPLKGKRAHSLQWMGATWRFENAENKTAFEKEPEAFAPRYGGYCAWAVSQGYTASIDPDAWDIHGGQLYLNFSKSVQRQWLKDKETHIRQADENWPRLLNQ